jgi:hypothetical protein
MKIGFFQKWNDKAKMKEFSITRLQMALFTVFAGFFIYQFYITEGNSVTVNSIVLVLVLLAGAFAPKALKDFSDLRDKIG